MRTFLLCIYLILSSSIFAQRECVTQKYVAGLAINADIAKRMADVENFILNSSNNIRSSIAKNKNYFETAKNKYQHVAAWH